MVPTSLTWGRDLCSTGALRGEKENGAEGAQCPGRWGPNSLLPQRPIQVQGSKATFAFSPFRKKKTSVEEEKKVKPRTRMMDLVGFRVVFSDALRSMSIYPPSPTMHSIGISAAGIAPRHHVRSTPRQRSKIKAQSPQ
jgi:hypothetical protein